MCNYILVSKVDEIRIISKHRTIQGLKNRYLRTSFFRRHGIVGQTFWVVYAKDKTMAQIDPNFRENYV